MTTRRPSCLVVKRREKNKQAMPTATMRWKRSAREWVFGRRGKERSCLTFRSLSFEANSPWNSPPLSVRTAHVNAFAMHSGLSSSTGCFLRDAGARHIFCLQAHFASGVLRKVSQTMLIRGLRLRCQRQANRKIGEFCPAEGHAKLPEHAGEAHGIIGICTPMMQH